MSRDKVQGHFDQMQCVSLLPAATKLGQGNVFTGVCDSVHGGGVCLSACWDTHPSWEQTPPGADPPGKQTLAYDQRAAGTHPTGMHSCYQRRYNGCHTGQWSTS